LIGEHAAKASLSFNDRGGTGKSQPRQHGCLNSTACGDSRMYPFDLAPRLIILHGPGGMASGDTKSMQHLFSVQTEQTPGDDHGAEGTADSVAVKSPFPRGGPHS
jgi:hypothetical protein